MNGFDEQADEAEAKKPGREIFPTNEFVSNISDFVKGARWKHEECDDRERSLKAIIEYQQKALKMCYRIINKNLSQDYPMTITGIKETLTFVKNNMELLK